tara:strand:+ start:206 stop:628 length:423 start_codon:yes stop_codon:yes gene_type:complete
LASPAGSNAKFPAERLIVNGDAFKKLGADARTAAHTVPFSPQSSTDPGPPSQYIFNKSIRGLGTNPTLKNIKNMQKINESLRAQSKKAKAKSPFKPKKRHHLINRDLDVDPIAEATAESPPKSRAADRPATPSGQRNAEA